MITFSDVMHDIGGEYTKFRMVSFDVNEDLLLLIKNGHIEVSNLDETINKTYFLLRRVKEYKAAVAWLIRLIEPYIEKIPGVNCEIYNLRTLNDKMANLALETLEELEKYELKKIPEDQLIGLINSTHDYIERMRGFSGQAEELFFKEKDKLYKVIDKQIEILPFGNGCRVLILDDEDDIAIFLKSYLNKRGFKVEYAKSAQIGMELAFRFQPQIALLDIKLGDSTVNGIEVLKFIKKEIPSCSCFMLTFIDDKEILKICTDAGARGSLPKPIDLKKICNSLWKVVREILNETQYSEVY